MHIRQHLLKQQFVTIGLNYRLSLVPFLATSEEETVMRIGYYLYHLFVRFV